ncbi:CRISPR-associated helicase Cas3' [Flectobacillus roseus]|uniref:CRISPR-associated helicase Cas3 n=1 Tax=Flectobacillus roseus TaxID=502259 RepID=A0ABT6Y203_9BACT|nr:CRISPR-associated helicase Cas3' [Flectobacillus roseus]MDI9857603.1 CRISPR-associated helicase Cas3' [Flectobacillus roseus]
MLTYKHFFELLLPIEQQLKNHSDYLAHLPNKENSDVQPPELLAEHCKLVNHYFERLIEEHNLELVIDTLVLELCEKLRFQNQEKAINFIKKLFFSTVVFHDYGKINEDFQVLRMSNKKFKTNKVSIFTPPHGHSWLGAYIFNSQFLEEVAYEQYEEYDEGLLFIITTFFSYSILMHHSSNLGGVGEKIENSKFGKFYEEMQPYLAKYGFAFNKDYSDFILKDDYNTLLKQFHEEQKKEEAFPLYALLKLNFSLLTASDFLATHEYMNSSEHGKEGATVDFGVFKSRERIVEICENIRKSQPHNQKTFTELESWKDYDAAKELQEMSKSNLNLLRQQMAVELIRNIRKNANKRLFYIEAPTGGGKTNLSMIALTELLAQNPDLNKVFYVFPFTTLITQTYKSLQETLMLNDNELVEIHSKAGFHSKREEKEDGEYGDDKKDYIDNKFALYPVSVLSHLKFFDILKTNNKETNYLLHRLANSIVIIDEVQTYNPNIWDKMLYFISQYSAYFNIRFILMSATLPKIDELDIPTVKKEFVNLLPNAQKYLSNPNFSQRVQFVFEEELTVGLTIEKLRDVVLEKSEIYANNKGSVRTIIEFIFKKSASSFRQLILDSEQTLFDEENILVLSGTILEPERRKIINKIKNKDNRGENILLITTQVVEAGVDIDMDLGFKNTSLLDSDEQLAGRVNRNASKDTCEVYLFKLNDANFIYGKDERYKVLKENKISNEEVADILNKKEFHRLYREVFTKIDGYNQKAYADNFEAEILDNVEKLNFDDIDRNFKIIDQQNETVFVPIHLPIQIESSKTGEQEDIFSDDDLKFLKTFNVLPEGELLDGREVWRVYELLIDTEIKNKKEEKGFDIKTKIDFKVLQSIMSKFTFSLFAHTKVVTELRSCGFIQEKYGFQLITESGLNLGTPVYLIEHGLNENAIQTTENFFL